MKRITRDFLTSGDQVVYVVREFSFNMSRGVVRVKIYFSNFPLRYLLFEFPDSRSNMRKSYELSTDKELYDDYFRQNYGIMPFHTVRSLSRPKYFGKNGRPLAAYYLIIH